MYIWKRRVLDEPGYGQTKLKPEYLLRENRGEDIAKIPTVSFFNFHAQRFHRMKTYLGQQSKIHKHSSIHKK